MALTGMAASTARGAAHSFVWDAPGSPGVGDDQPMRIMADLVDLLLPSHCVSCLRAGPVWCAGCSPDGRCEVIALPNGPPVHAAAEYADGLRAALLAYKERGVRGLAGQLADYLSAAVELSRRACPSPEPPALVTVPSARSAARQRGGDHVLRLARLVARQSSLELLPLLRLAGPVADSAGLSVPQRASNLAHRMVARPPGGDVGRPLIILDDIVTTGTTLSEAQRALQASGWPVLGAAVIGWTRRRRPTVDQPAPRTSRGKSGQRAELGTD